MINYNSVLKLVTLLYKIRSSLPEYMYHILYKEHNFRFDDEQLYIEYKNNIYLYVSLDVVQNSNHKDFVLTEEYKDFMYVNFKKFKRIAYVDRKLRTQSMYTIDKDIDRSYTDEELFRMEINPSVFDKLIMYNHYLSTLPEDDYLIMDSIKSVFYDNSFIDIDSTLELLQAYIDTYCTKDE